MTRRADGDRGGRYGPNEVLGDVASEADQPAAQPACLPRLPEPPMCPPAARPAPTCKQSGPSLAWRISLSDQSIHKWQASRHEEKR